jgi:hypothetical protein
MDNMDNSMSSLPLSNGSNGSGQYGDPNSITTFGNVIDYDDEDINTDALDFDDEDLNFSKLEKFMEENIQSIMDEEDNEENYTIDFEKYNYNDKGIDLKYDDVIGLDNAKQLLINKILKPYICPDHYQGVTEMKNISCIYGQEGSGKRTLVKSFCRMIGIKLIIINGKIIEQSMMERLMGYAQLNQPCLIYFDCCEHFFRNGVNDNVGKGFMYLYELNKIEDNQIWVVIGTTALYRSEFFHNLSEYIENNSARVTPLTKPQRKVIFRRFLGSHYKELGHRNFNDEEYEELIDELAGYSEDHTPKQIQNYIKKVFSKKLDDTNISDLIKCNKSSSDILPDKTSFENMIFVPSNGRGRLSLEDPKHENLKYVAYDRKINNNLRSHSLNNINHNSNNSRGSIRLSSGIKRTSTSANLSSEKLNNNRKRFKSSHNNGKNPFNDLRKAIDGHPELVN